MACLHAWPAIIIALAATGRTAAGDELRLGGRALGGPSLALAASAERIYVGAGATIQIYVEGSLAPTATVTTAGVVRGLATSGDLLLMAGDEAGLVAFDTSDPDSPLELSTLDLGASVRSVDLVGALAHVTAADSGYQIIDYQIPEAPVVLGTLTEPEEFFRDAEVNGDRTLLATKNRLWVVDNTRPDSLVVLGSLGGLGPTHSVDVAGDFAYVATGPTAMQIVDISDPPLMYRTGGLHAGGRATAIVVADSVAYLADQVLGLRVISVSSEVSPFELGAVESEIEPASLLLRDDQRVVVGGGAGRVEVVRTLDPRQPQIIKSAYTGGRTIYGGDLIDAIAVGGGIEGIEILSTAFTPYDPQPLLTFPTSGPVRDLAVRDGVIFAAMGGDGLSLVEAAVPSNPHLLSTLRSYRAWNRVALLETYAYLLSHESARIEVVNASLPTVPVKSDDVLPLGERTGELAAGGDLVFVTLPGTEAANGGMIVVDASERMTPVAVGLLRGYEAVHDVAAGGGRAFLAAGSQGMVPIDVSTPQFPRPQLPWIPDAGAVTAVSVRDDLAALLLDGYPEDAVVYLDVTEGLIPTELARFEAVAVFGDEVELLDRGIRATGRLTGLTTWKIEEDVGTLLRERSAHRVPPFAADGSSSARIEWCADSDSRSWTLQRRRVRSRDWVEVAAGDGSPCGSQLDSAVPAGAHEYRLVLGPADQRTSSAPFSLDWGAPGTGAALHPPAPNPFNPSTLLGFVIGEASATVDLSVYNLKGERVRNLVRGERRAGLHRVRFDGLSDRGSALPSGLYLARLSVAGRIHTQRLALLR